MIYHRKSGVFRAAVPVCSAGVEVLCVLHDGRIACGGGDSTLKILIGDGDLSWEFD